MIGQFLGKFDDKLFQDWKLEATNLINLFNQGLAKLDFGSATPEEITNIKAACIALDNQSITREGYYKQVEIIKNELEKLALNKNLNDSEANNFIFQALRSFGLLQSALLTFYNKYAEAVLNPSGKEQEEEELAFFQGKLIGKAARNFTDNLIKNLQQDATPYMKIQVDRLQKNPTIKINTIEDYSKTGLPPSELEQRIGKDKYKKLGSEVQVNNAQDAAKYISEETYGNSFEAMYMHVASFCDALNKINALSQAGGSVVTIIKERERLLKEQGLTELDSLETKEYLNHLAQHLGFSDADDLYVNYQNLKQPNGFDVFKEKKKEFVEYAHRDIAAKDDPLEKIKKEVTNEFQRIQEQRKQQGLSQEKSNYVSLIAHAATNIIPAINKAQRTKNIGEIVGEDFSGVNKLLGYGIVGFAMNWLNLKKYAIDGYVLQNLKKEVNLAQRRMPDVMKYVDAQWTKKIAAEVQEQQARRDKLIGKGQWKEYSDEELTQNYLNSMREYKKALQDFAKVSTKGKTDPEYIHRHTILKTLEEKYKNFRDAYKLKANDDIRSLSSEDLEHYIAKKAVRIESVSEEMNIKVKALSALKDEERNQKSSILGRVASFFGYKPKSVKQRENEIQRLYDEIEPLGLELEIQRDLISRAESQSTIINEYVHSSPSKLAITINSLNGKYLEAYQKMVIDYKTAADGHNIIPILFKHQSKLASIENKLMLAMKQLTEKIKVKAIDTDFKKLSPDEIAKLHHVIAQIRGNISNFDRSITGLESGKQHPLLAQLAELETQVGVIIQGNQALNQEKIFNQAKAEVSNLFSSKPLSEIPNPFQFIVQNKGIPFDQLSEPNKRDLNKHIAASYIILLNKSISSMSIDECEKLYFGLEASRSQTKDPSLVSYYESFSQVILPKLNTALPKELSDWDAEFNRLTTLVQTAKQNTQAAQSWFRNFFGRTSVEDTKAHEVAVLEYYQRFATQYLSIASQFYPSLDHADLTAHIQRLNDINNKLQAILKIDSTNQTLLAISKECQQRIETASNLDRSHSSLAHSLPTAISQADENAQKLIALEKEIDQTIISKHVVPSLAEYQNLIRQISTNRDIVEQQMKEMDSRFGHLNPTDRSKNKDYMQWQKDKIIVKSKLEDIDKSLKDINQNKLVVLQFFHDISQKKKPTLNMPPLSTDDLGKGLILAIVNGNDCVPNLLNAAKIDSSYLTLALKEAAARGDLTNVQSILHYRKDINFDVRDSIKQANANIPSDNTSLDEPHRKVLHYLLMNSSFIPSVNDANDRKALEEILTKLNSNNANLSSVQMNLIDSDGPKLETIRQYFVLQADLIASLDGEYRVLLSKTAKINDKDSSEYLQLKEEIDHFYGKLNRIDDIGKALESYYPYTDNKDRKAKLLSTWQNELKKMTSKLDDEVQRILAPPSIDVQETPKVAMQQPPKIESVQNVSKVKHEKRAQQTQSLSEQPTQPEKIPDSDYQFKNANQKLQEMLSRPWPSASRLKTILTELKGNLTPENKDEYNSILSSALNQLTKNDRVEAFTVVLSFVEDKQLKHELIRNALGQAFDAKKLDIVKYIFENRLFTIENQQVDLQFFMDIFKSQADATVKALIVSYVPLALNEDIRNLMQGSDLANESTISEIEPDKALWFYQADQDKPHLAELQKAYQFCEKTLIDIEDDIFWRFANIGSPFQEAMSSSHLSLEDLQRLENQIDERKKAFQEQVKALKSLKQQYVDSIKNASPKIISNEARLTEHIEKWDRNLVSIISKATVSMTKTLNELKTELEELKKGIKAKQQVVDSAGTTDMTQKRQPNLSFSKDKKEGSEVLPSSDNTSEPSVPPPKTRKTTR